MGFRDWLKAKKKKRQQERMEKRQAEELVERKLVLNNNDNGFAVDPSDINPPETRFTEEYKEFIEAQEGVTRSAETAEEAISEACEAAEACEDHGENKSDDN